MQSILFLKSQLLFACSMLLLALQAAATATTSAAAHAETYCIVQPYPERWKAAKKQSPHLLTELELLESFPQSVWLRSMEAIDETVSLIQNSCKPTEVVTVIIDMADRIRAEHEGDSWEAEYSASIISLIDSLTTSERRINLVIEPGTTSEVVINTFSNLPPKTNADNLIHYYVYIRRGQDDIENVSKSLKMMTFSIKTVGVAFSAPEHTSSSDYVSHIEYCRLVREKTQIPNIPCLLDASTTLEEKPELSGAAKESIEGEDSDDVSVAWFSIPGFNFNGVFDVEKFAALWNGGYLVTRHGSKRVNVDGYKSEMFEELRRDVVSDDDEHQGWFAILVEFFARLFSTLWTIL